MEKPFRVSDRARSFRFAFRGLWTMLKSQHNAWIHLVATVLVITAGFILSLNLHEWGIVVLAIMAVWTAEAINTAFEFLADVASPEFHPLVEKAKDVAAGAVLLTAMGSLVIAALIVVPRLLSSANT